MRSTRITGLLAALTGLLLALLAPTASAEPRQKATGAELRAAILRISADGGTPADRRLIANHPRLGKLPIPDGSLDEQSTVTTTTYRKLPTEHLQQTQAASIECTMRRHTVHKKSFPLRQTLYKQHHRARFCTSALYTIKSIDRRAVWNTEMSFVITPKNVWSNRKGGVGTFDAFTRMGRRMVACYPGPAGCVNLYPWLRIRQFSAAYIPYQIVKKGDAG